MGEVCDGVLHGGDDGRVGCADAGHGDAGGEVDEGVAVGVDEDATVGVDDVAGQGRRDAPGDGRGGAGGQGGGGRAGQLVGDDLPLLGEAVGELGEDG